MCSVNGVSLKNQWHLTGDQVLLQNDGSIVFLGRINESKIIKKLGQKINLTEIETETVKTCLVENCVAMTNIFENINLVIFVTMSCSKLPMEDLEVEVLHRLQKVLPPVSIPEAVICVDKLNLTQHGKIDEQSLKKKAETWLRKSKIPRVQIFNRLQV